MRHFAHPVCKFDPVLSQIKTKPNQTNNNNNNNSTTRACKGNYYNKIATEKVI